LVIPLETEFLSITYYIGVASHKTKYKSISKRYMHRPARLNNQGRSFHESRPKNRMRLGRGFIKLFLLIMLSFAVITSCALAYGWHSYKNQVVALPQKPLDFKINKGAGMKQVAASLNAKGLNVSSNWLWLVSRLRGDGGQLKAGTYRLTEGVTLEKLLNKIVAGDVILSEIRFIEGWTFAQMRKALDQHPEIRHDTAGMPEADILKKLGASEKKAEGLFFPSTYPFSPGASDLEVYKQAYTLMSKTVAQVWQNRQANLPLNSPYELLTLASIIEKETGRESDRDKVAAVFINRLRKGMMLQSDPTTIYGMGERFDGNIRRKDLKEDTPYNTYTRTGLTPTPISLPGKASLQAAVSPAAINAIFFVARGDGTSEFTETLQEHNRAVAKFQLGK
jgi:UPF0755 protein